MSKPQFTISLVVTLANDGDITAARLGSMIEENLRAQIPNIELKFHRLTRQAKKGPKPKPRKSFQAMMDEIPLAPLE